MSAFSACIGLRSASLSAVVTRCGCGTPEKHSGAVCPKPSAVEDRGTVAYWHSNPLKRLDWRAKRFFKE